jgi:predicted enzyme related to lactoylglutathione lyase
MLDRNGYPPGVPCWVDTAPPDPEAAVAFYQNLRPICRCSRPAVPVRLGADPGHIPAPDLGDEVEPVGPRGRAVLELPPVDDADVVARRAEELGGEVLAPPVDAPWVRFTVLRDPLGAAFTASKFVPPG